MSAKELQRGERRSRVEAGELPRVEAAELLGLCYRQTQRRGGRYRPGGAPALPPGQAGRRGNRAKPRGRRAVGAPGKPELHRLSLRSHSAGWEHTPKGHF
jgi:hypothetical protein